ELLSRRSLDELAALRQQVAEGANPRDTKILLAKEIISRYHSEAAAEQAHQDFVQRFQKNAIPDDLPEVTLNAGVEGIGIANLLKDEGLVTATCEDMRMIKQGALKVDGDKLEDGKLQVKPGQAVYQIGKRKFAKVTVA